jgi:SAM-dependent methyltransferase
MSVDPLPHALPPEAAAAYEERELAEAYHRGRPGYPAAALELMFAGLGLGPDTAVLDVAAGTGKLTAALAPRCRRVIALDRSDAMLAVLGRELPTVERVVGSAEAIPLPDDAVAAICVADAFHWFDAPAALAEFARVIAPGGRVAILKHAPAPAPNPPAWGREYDRLLASVQLFDPADGPDAPLDSPHSWRQALRAAERLRVVAEHEVVQDYEQPPEGFVDYARSRSFIGALAPADREAALMRIRQLLDDHAVTTVVTHYTVSVVVLVS